MGGGFARRNSSQTRARLLPLLHPQQASGNGPRARHKPSSSPSIPVALSSNPDLRHCDSRMKLAHSPEAAFGKKFLVPRRHRNQAPSGEQRYALSRNGKPWRRRIEVDRAARVRLADVVGDRLDPYAFGRDKGGEDLNAILLGAIPVRFGHDWDKAARLLAYKGICAQVGAPAVTGQADDHALATGGGRIIGGEFHCWYGHDRRGLARKLVGPATEVGLGHGFLLERRHVLP